MWEIITSFTSKFFTVFKGLAGTLFMKGMATMGLTFVTYKAVLPEVKAFVQGYFNELPASIYAIATAISFDVFVVAVLSALVVQTGSRALLSSISNLPGSP